MQQNRIIDSGCTSHVTYNQTAFISYHPFSSSRIVDLGADSKTEIVGSGSVSFLLKRNGSSVAGLIENVFHVPALRYQLLSVSAIAKRGICTIFNEQDEKLTHQSDSFVIGNAI